VSFASIALISALSFALGAITSCVLRRKWQDISEARRASQIAKAQATIDRMTKATA